MENEPVIPSPVEVRIYDFRITGANYPQITIRFEDGTDLLLEFAPESDGTAQIVELFTELVTEKLVSIGERGIVITGFTPPEDDEDEDT